jgi:hypothetical protein
MNILTSDFFSVRTIAILLCSLYSINDQYNCHSFFVLLEFGVIVWRPAKFVQSSRRRTMHEVEGYMDMSDLTVPQGHCAGICY